MVSLETLHISSPARISFSADLLKDAEELGDLISSSSSSNTNNVVQLEDDDHHQLSKKTMISIIKAMKKKKAAATAGIEERPTPCRRNADFEFLCGTTAAAQKMVSADELFSDGKLLPYWQMDRLTTIQTKPAPQQSSIRMSSPSDHGAPHGGGRVSWGFMDDDPSPRPPKCTVLWKELLRIKKNKPHSSLSPSSSSGSSSSSSSSMAADENKKKTESSSNNLKKRIQRGLERTSSTTIRIRPMVNVPIVKTGSSSSSLPPLFPVKKATRSVESL